MNRLVLLPLRVSGVLPKSVFSENHSHLGNSLLLTLHHRCSQPVHPGPLTAKPGISPVCCQSDTTPTPFTKTCTTPVDSWWGRSYVA